AENDSIPSLTNMQVEHANWLYFCPWYDSGDARFVTGENYQDKDEVKKLYNSDYCLTLDELPKDLFKGSGETKTTESTKATSATTTTTTTAKTTTSASGSETTVSGQTGKVTLAGDVNLDKIVDVSDAVLLARFTAEDKTADISAQGKLNADMDGSGMPDSEDVVLILKKIAKLI
ncbi:MAG: dockerin type I repeat-containing protein, partial [Oscillospiraceae bacterium]|nr:dockerin type I repeat-containing protein [Oscillospiraceae bacterium]